MFGLMRLFKRSGTTGERAEDAATAAAIERIVAGTAPRIRGINGYRKKLKAPVETALAYIDGIVAGVPGPLEICPDYWENDPLVQALFLDEHQLKSVLKSSPELAAFFADTNTREGYFLLTMTSAVRTVFGTDLEGDVVKKDVARKSVTFSDHQVAAPAATREAALNGLKQGILNVLAAHALENILEDQARRDEFQNLRDELKEKVDLLVAYREKMRLDPAAGHRVAEAQALLAQAEAQLSEARAKVDGLDDHLRHVTDVLTHPQDYLKQELHNLALDRMGVLIEGPCADPADQICLIDIVAAEDKRRSAVLLKCRREVFAAL
jgi:hypothetical protein